MKSFLVLIILIFLTACINTRYYYYPENYKNNNISVSGNLVEFNNQNSPLNNIWILDLRDNYNEKHKAKILSSTIKINSNGKEYAINTKPDSDHIESLQDKEKSRHNCFNVSAGSSSVGAGVKYGKSLGSDLDKMTGGKYDLENKLGQGFYNSYIKFKT